MKASFKAFMQGIIDYAGLFPPADLSLDTSLQKFSNYRKGEDAWMLSRFVIPAMRLPELEPYGATLFEDESPFDFSILGKGTETLYEYKTHLDELISAINKFNELHGSKVTSESLEIKLPREAVLANDLDLLVDLFDDTLQRFDKSEYLPNQVYFEGFFEENWKKEISLILKAMHRHGESFTGEHVLQPAFKLRCGGVKAEIFPSVEQVAFALNMAREQNVALKCTAGLHHPIRHYADSVQTRMHGFINVFGGAMLSYAHDLSNDELQDILKEEDPKQFEFTENGFKWKDLQISTHEIAELREVAVKSFGSCSFDEPREDLRHLGLL